jgi:glycosyltransferase involved in cell wall biosynthesis
MPSLAVSIATFKRPADLTVLLDSLAAHLSVPPGWSVARVVVVDNDPAQSARAACDRSVGRVRLDYGTEAEPGISATRNTGLALCGDVDFVVLIDDDEFITGPWPGPMCTTQETHQADFVAGPVESHFDVDPPGWAKRGGWYDRERFPTGTPQDTFRTGNLLMRCAALDKLGPPVFDPTFGLTGGSDTDLAERALRLGMKLVWDDDGVVYERVPPERATGRWLRRRWFRQGSIYARVVVAGSDGTLTGLARAVFGGVGRIGYGLALSPLMLSRTSDRQFFGLRCILFGAGMLTGTAGREIRGYGSTATGS